MLVLDRFTSLFRGFDCPTKGPRGLKLVIALGTCLFAAACGPKVTVKPPEGITVPSMIAILPADYSNDVTRERVDYVRSALIAELRNKNFVVLDDKTVQSTCSNAECPEKALLSKNFPIGAYVSLRLDSFSRNNFIAGYYNALTGTLSVLRQDGSDLFKVEHTERERGGLLFESGQVFQGIISQVKNSGDSAFNNLATRFVRTLIAQFPEPKSDSPGATTIVSSAPVIQSTEITAQSPTVSEVCARGTGAAMGFITVGKVRSGLREVSPGFFCASFPLETLTMAPKPLVVELRSAFGSAARNEIAGTMSAPCDLQNRVFVASKPLGSQLSIACSSLDAATTDCAKGQARCSIARAVIYRGNSSFGPYLKIGESRAATWTDRTNKRPGTAPTYQVVAIDDKGLRSLPAAAVPQ